MNSMFDDCLIMAGGSGTRLWPASNSKRPKQFLPIGDDKNKTFLSLSIERALQVVEKKSGRVIVVAGKSHLPFVVASCSSLNAAEKKRVVLIPEPVAKNTAPAIACAVAYSRMTGGLNNNLLVLTCDHLINPPEVFLKDAGKAADFAEKNRLVVFGISPSRPETGYGYIKAGKKLAEGVHAVDAFLEKPDQKKAEKLAASKRFFWNSGMFAFGCAFLTEELHRHAGNVIRPFEELRAPGEKAYVKSKGIRIVDSWTGLDTAYHQTEKISFDHAIAEKCTRTVMVEAAFEWVDVGDWDEYSRLLSNDSAGNTGADVYSAGTSGGCFVDSDIPVALAGVEDLIVVIRSGKNGSPSAALIVKKGNSQQVKDIVEQIKKTGKTDIL